ncbi:hypothetical protein PHLGIDRAFT_128994 [Phlebiopsis gigantea 11061_1 CR5-6]|uniref:Uncharacterized protein n=1 Tax=Phlebiopsis gigantea (strain 11061_1 CR5-6) TaxID=745531 RepID=A0A0C3S4W5_PHLG1|nr:hypothetical protein PHLGIDRAFT_128994 [Phlebiopsis gigantea 11061_1 CR5-6]
MPDLCPIAILRKLFRDAHRSSLTHPTAERSTMAHSSASSDDEAPEAFSFSNSKKTAESEAKVLQQFHAEEKLKLKEKRRQRDRTLKERAKGKGKAKETTVAEARSSESDAEDSGREAGGSASREELEARMDRAMLEADAESSEEEEDSIMGDASSSGDDDEPGAEAHDAGSVDAVAPAPTRPKRTPAKQPISSSKKDYLPEHLFTSAFSQLPPSAPAPKSKKRAASPPAPHRKRAKKARKDLSVGSRTVRTLPAQTPARGLAPPARVSRFLARTLNARGGAQEAKVRGWERKAAHIGVLKRSGPAARFVRDE